MISFILKGWNALANIGITDDLPFLEKKKTQVTNLVVGIGLPLFFYFAIVNTLDGLYLLASLNLSLLIGGTIILVTQYKKKYILARVIVVLISTSIFTAQSLLFNNGNENLLLVNLIVTIIYYSDKRFIVLISTINVVCYVWIKYQSFNPPIFETVSNGRVLFNICIGLLSMIVALQYFKFEQLNSQKAIEQKNQELEALNKTKEKLFSIIAHDLRSPIAQIKSTLDLVNRDFISKEEFHELSHHFTKQIDQLQDNMNNLLTWSQSQLNGISTKPQAVNASLIIKEVIELLRQQWQAKDIQIQFEAFDNLVWIDPDHLKVVMRNLLSNAIKFSKKKHSIVINHSRNNKELTIAIRDTGIGIDQHQLDSLFTAEEIISTHGTDKERGTGLGLKLCKEFLEKNKGEIWAISEKGIGSTFFINIPLYHPASTTA